MRKLYFAPLFGIILVLIAGCSSNSSTNSSVTHSQKPTVKDLSQLAVVSSEQVGKFQIVQHDFDQSNNFVLTVSPVIENQLTDVQNIAQEKLQQICEKFKRESASSDAGVNQIIPVFGSGGYRTPVYNSNEKKIFYYMSCSVLREN